jgi:phage terminase Nu1 subunit (DNA packaging protein)
MRISLPNGDTLIPDREFADKLGVVVRTLSNYDKAGCPFVMVGGKKYRPENEGLNWIASRIRRRNPPRRSRALKPEAA